MSTYQEPVYRFRVMRQMNDAERNPEGDWDLIYSSPDYGNAEEVAADVHERAEAMADHGAMPDQIKVVESKVEIEYIERQDY